MCLNGLPSEVLDSKTSRFRGLAFRYEWSEWMDEVSKKENLALPFPQQVRNASISEPDFITHLGQDTSYSNPKQRKVPHGARKREDWDLCRKAIYGKSRRLSGTKVRFPCGEDLRFFTSQTATLFFGGIKRKSSREGYVDCTITRFVASRAVIAAFWSTPGRIRAPDLGVPFRLAFRADAADRSASRCCLRFSFPDRPLRAFPLRPVRLEFP